MNRINWEIVVTVLCYATIGALGWAAYRILEHGFATVGA